MAHCVVRTDNLAGIIDGSKLVSVKYHDGADYAAIDNGAVVKLDSMITGERDLWKAVKCTANDTPAATNHKLVLLAAPEYNYDDNYANLDEYQNEAGKAVLGYVLQSGDIFSITVDGFQADPSTNTYVVADANAKLTTASASTNAFAEILKKENEGGYEYYVIRVL